MVLERGFGFEVPMRVCRRIVGTSNPPHQARPQTLPSPTPALAVMGALYACLDHDRQWRRGEAVPEDPILQTEDLTKEFAGFVAVRSVNLQVGRGTIHALIGPNGAGKTTCFNLLTKFLSPTRGRIMFDGRDITALKPADVARLGIGRSFQISAVFPHLTVLENVRIALQRRRGNSFDFWRSKRALASLDKQAQCAGRRRRAFGLCRGRWRLSFPMGASGRWKSPRRSRSTRAVAARRADGRAWAAKTFFASAG